MLTIFDCDGVLVDSELLAAEVNAEFFKDVGYDLTPLELIVRFAGLTGDEIAATIEREIGRLLPEDMKPKIDAEIDRRLATVKAIAGIHELLDVLEGPRCICSNSSSARLAISLGATGLYDRFKPYVFSARDVREGRGKPAPDVFLHAADVFGVDPRDAVVIEDSTHGVIAAVAAGMRVIGFTGGAHTWSGHADALTDAGAETVVKRLTDVAPMIDAVRSWGGVHG